MAQPLLSCRPPPGTMLAHNTCHQPSTTWLSGPRSWVDRARSSAWSRSCSNRTGRRQTRRHGPARPARTAPDRSPARHRSHDGSSRSDQSSAQCDSVCSGEPTCRPHRRSARPPSSDWSDETDGRVADGDSAGITANTIRHWMTSTTLPMARPMLHPRCIALLGRFRVERRANGEASSVMACV